jgi:hypothetical protein
MKQDRTIDSWSGDLLRIQPFGVVAVMMNDLTLKTIVLPLKGVKCFDQFLPVFLQRVAVVMNRRREIVNTQNLTVMVMGRSNRRLIGSMNEAKLMIREEAEAQRLSNEKPDYFALELAINDCPFSILKYRTPDEALKEYE